MWLPSIAFAQTTPTSSIGTIAGKDLIPDGFGGQFQSNRVKQSIFSGFGVNAVAKFFQVLMLTPWRNVRAL
jgi:hypothetical protein